MSLEENFDSESYAQSEQYQAQTTVQSANLNSTTADTKPPVVWTVSDMATGESPGTYNIYNALMKNNQYTFYSDLVHSYTNKWQQNFEYTLGPANPAFIDATLSYQDIAWGYRLEYNPNGILWRVSAAGIPHPDDFNNFIEQNKAIESTTELTVAEVQTSISSETANQSILPKANLNSNNDEPKISSSDTQINQYGTLERYRNSEIVTSNSSSKHASLEDFGERVLQVARQQLGIPYQLGGDGILTTDCGKFTLDNYKKVGIDLGTRMADEQYEYCKSKGSVFTDFSQAKPGDLVFFKNTYGNWEPGTITHVGFYAGDGNFLHASSSRGVSYADLSNEYWQAHFAGFGKVR